MTPGHRHRVLKLAFAVAVEPGFCGHAGTAEDRVVGGANRIEPTIGCAGATPIDGQQITGGDVERPELVVVAAVEEAAMGFPARCRVTELLLPLDHRRRRGDRRPTFGPGRARPAHRRHHQHRQHRHLSAHHFPLSPRCLDCSFEGRSG